MTAGTVVILGRALKNMGAGMTGGIIYTYKSNKINLNEDFVKSEELEAKDKVILEQMIQKHIKETGSSIEVDDFGDFIKLVALSNL
jgi:glutamate synthase (NADPH/NADH) large chain